MYMYSPVTRWCTLKLVRCINVIHRKLFASILRVNVYTYLVPVSFLGLADFSSIEKVRGEETGSLWGVTAVGKRNWFVLCI